MLKRWSWLLVIAALSVVYIAPVAHAQEEPEASSDSEAGLDLTLRSKATAMPVVTLDKSAMETPASHMYLVDSGTGAVLAHKAGEAAMYPSSMTKIMTLYVLFSRLKEGAVSLDSQFTVSEKAWRMQGSKMFVPLGGQVKLEDLIRGIAIQSGNDACVAVAEGIAGSEEAFVKMMNDTATKLGMKKTNFMDASGWPHPKHLTTAQDLATLGTALIRDFPEYYHYDSEREFTYNGIRQFNRNLLLGNPSLKVDGIKTGHTDAAGYGITLSALDPASNRRLVLVINGLDSDAARAQEGERLLKWGFANFKNVPAFAPDKPVISTKAWMGDARELPLVVAENVLVTSPVSGAPSYKAIASYPSVVAAPITKGQELGTLTITLNDGSAKEVKLLAGADVAKLSFFGRMGRTLGLK